MNRFAALGVLGGVMLAGAVFYHSRRESSAPPATIRSEYADPGACAACHREIAASYRLTGMGRSFSRPRAQNNVEDYQNSNTLYHQPSDRYYTMLEREGKFFQRRHQLGVDGKPINVVERQVDFVLGSGNHARSLLHRNTEGKLIELPVTWYTEKGGYWVSP